MSPSMGPALESVQVPMQARPVDGRVVGLCAACILLAIVAALVAQALLLLINLITNLSFFATPSFKETHPTTDLLGPWMILVPVAGALIIGVMARYGSKAIRGHGIPEAMEQVLRNRSRIGTRVMFLKPLSAAIAIGTGGPFGAEGPIIATGGALGSVVGQALRITTNERKTLLAAGAAAGMAATFGSPAAAVLLAVELLLFEFRARSLVPVALAAAAAAATRVVFHGVDPVFHMPDIAQPAGIAMAAYILIGAVIGIAAVAVTRIVYLIEDGFERLPIHWMWWPAMGAVVVGVIGYVEPRTLGVGYYNISDLISGNLTIQVAIWLCLLKFVSWAIYLGSGTSGGTLAPLFTIGGGLGLVMGAAADALVPIAEIDPRVAALVGMAAIFAGASRAMLASAVFAFETTLQPLGLLPLLGGCASAYLVSSLLMPTTIMTEKIARRGVRVPDEYAADFLDQVRVEEAATMPAITLRGSRTLRQVRDWIRTDAADTTHQGFPVVGEQGTLLGVVTRRQFLDPAQPDDTRVSDLIRRPPIIVYEDSTLREAADHMVNHDVGRLPVMARSHPSQLRGILTRSDLLRAHRHRLRDLHEIDRNG